jgi:hypothetical protein
MKTDIFIPALYHYKFKIFGIVLFITLLMIAIVVSLFQYQNTIDPYLIKWGILVALTIISFSKEREENVRIKHIRLITQTYTLQFLISFTVAYNIVIYLFGLTDILSSLDLILMGFVLNVLLFYSIKWIGSESIELEYKSITQIVKENPQLFIIWIIMSILTLLMIMLFI